MGLEEGGGEVEKVGVDCVFRCCRADVDCYGLKTEGSMGG